MGGYHFLYGKEAYPKDKRKIQRCYIKKKTVCLYIADDYEFMDETLIETLQANVSEYL